MPKTYEAEATKFGLEATHHPCYGYLEAQAPQHWYFLQKEVRNE